MPGVDPVGFTSVMMDGSLEEDMKTPASYDYNVAVTAKVVEMAHAVGVSVEGELGCLGSLESGTAGEEDGSGAEGILSHDQLLTDPEQAADFVAKTGVDAAMRRRDFVMLLGGPATERPLDARSRRIECDASAGRN
jgi:fructose/tagatose bisphosphate aldolase